MAIWNRLYFPAFPAPSGGHVIKFWPMGSNWKWDMKLPVNILKNKGLVFPLFARWSSYFGLWCGSFTLRMAEQQNRRSLGFLALWNHYHQPYYPHRAFTWDRQILPCLRHFHFGFSIIHSWTLILSGIPMQENWRVWWEIITETVGFDRKKGFQRPVLWGSNF